MTFLVDVDNAQCRRMYDKTKEFIPVFGGMARRAVFNGVFFGGQVSL